MSNQMTKNDLTESLDELAIKLIKHSDTMKSELLDRMDKQDKKIDGLYGLVDTYAKDVEIYQQEMLASNHQTDRLKRWVEQIAKQTGVKLEY